MPFSIHSNLLARTTARNLGNTYSRLSDSVRRLASGLRVTTAADDAAGLAIRELQRADIASLHQGARNANDAISLIQTADGALAVIDEKLIRMKELAEQAATGTYDSTQRLLIDSEFQAMASEIERIAKATDFNGIKLLDGSLNGEHDGSGMVSTGAMKIHFGTGNDSAEDYYYLDIGDATLSGLGLREGGGTGGTGGTGGGGGYGGVPILSDRVTQGVAQDFQRGPTPGTFSCMTFAVIPAGTTGLSLYLDDGGRNDTFQIFTRSGKHLAGTVLSNWVEGGAPVRWQDFMTEANGFLPDASYNVTQLNGRGGNIPVDYTAPTINNFTVNGMNIGYTGDGGNQYWPPMPEFRYEELEITNVTEDLIIIIAGYDSVKVTANWTAMGTGGGGGTGGGDTDEGPVMSIKTQDLAQQALPRLDEAIVKKDNIRAHLGATQNRLENTVTNLAIQAENLQASESRISDVDVAAEMTEFTRNQVLTQAGTAMLAQANTLPKMLAGLLQG